MSKFVYEAKQGPGNVVKGTIEAQTQDAAIDRLNAMHLFPISIQEEESALNETKKKFSLPDFKQKITSEDLSIFTRQLSDLLESGLTLFRSLEVVREQTENKQLKKIILQVHASIKEGQALSEAFRKHPEVFSKLYISMVKTGEVGGMLGKVLVRLADFAEKENDMKSRVHAALAYPMLMASVGLLTIIVLLTFVIPKLAVMFEDMDQLLPLPTRMLVGFSDFLTTYWLFLGTGGIFIYLLFKRWKKTPEGKLSLDRFKLKIPLAGTIIQKTEISRFGSTLSTLLANGVPLLTSLTVVSETIENQALKQALEKAWQQVREGGKLGKSLEMNPYFPVFAVNMINVGEEGGRLEQSLQKIADSYSREVDRALKIMTSLLEPVMILMLGVVVTFIVLSMLLPIFQINLMMH